MKIAFVDWMCDPARPAASGLSDITWALARHLAMAGDDVHVFGPYTSVPTIPGVQVHCYPLPLIAYRNIFGHILIALRGLSYVRRSSSWDIIHAPEYLTTALAALLLRQTPVVLTVPGNIFERISNVNHFDPITTQVYKLAARTSARHCAGIIATSQEQARWWKFSGANPARIATIPLGVDTEFCRPASTLQKRRRHLLFVGRLQSENGVSEALRAFALAYAVHPDLTFTIVGDGPDRQKLIKLAGELRVDHAITWRNRVSFTALPEIYQAADLLLFPRHSRVTPRVLFEAMASGLPIVTSAIGGIAEFVHHGETGLLADSCDIAALAQQIRKLVENPDFANQIGLQARAYACRELDWSVVVQRVRTEVYHPIAAYGSLQLSL